MLVQYLVLMALLTHESTCKVDSCRVYNSNSESNLGLYITIEAGACAPGSDEN